jgi:hypothetical protein
MKKGNITQYWAVIAAAAIVVSTTGCLTLGGLIIGGASDVTQSPTRLIVPRSILTIATDTPITLIYPDGKRLDGVYTGLTDLTAEQYASRYDAWREQSPTRAFLPSSGQTVEAGADGRPAQKITWIALEPKSLLYRIGNESNLGRADLSRFQSFRLADGLPVDTVRMAKLLTKEPPLYPRRICVQTSDKAVVVPWDEIAHIEAKKAKKGWLAGPLTGLAFDASIMLIVAIFGFKW